MEIAQQPALQTTQFVPHAPQTQRVMPVPPPPAVPGLYGHCQINGKVMYNPPPAYTRSGAQTARVAQSPYQTQYLNRTRSNGAGTSRVHTARYAKRPVPPPQQVLNRATTPKYVLNSISGYGGFLPNRRFLRGGMSYQSEIEVMDYEGMQYQQLKPTQVPQRGNTQRFQKDTICPGYAGHVPERIFQTGNYRVAGFQQQYKGSIHGRPFHKCPTYLQQ